MTNETQYNSVAGRVMTEQRRRDKWSPTYEGGLYENAKLRGMKELHRELSREARAIMKDFDNVNNWYAMDMFKWACERLGLNLEPEDGDA